MDYINGLPPAIQDRLPEGPALTDWLLAELDRAEAEAVPLHAEGCEDSCRGPEHTLAGIRMMRAFVLKHRAGPTYVTNVFDPTGPDMRDGWHCQECGLDRDGPTDDWPCEVLVMGATLFWYAQRPNQPVTWAWTAAEDQLIWRRGGAGGQTTGGRTTGAGREPVEPEFRTHVSGGRDGDSYVRRLRGWGGPDD